MVTSPSEKSDQVQLTYGVFAPHSERQRAEIGSMGWGSTGTLTANAVRRPSRVPRDRRYCTSMPEMVAESRDAVKDRTYLPELLAGSVNSLM
jgi:hypothetical protein